MRVLSGNRKRKNPYLKIYENLGPNVNVDEWPGNPLRNILFGTCTGPTAC